MMKLPNRRYALSALAGTTLLVATGAASCSSDKQQTIRIAANGGNEPLNAPGFPQMSDADWKSLTATDWKARLSPQAFAVLRKENTERAFTSPLNDEKRDGWFACAGCGQVLFSSKTKYNSGTGWPSFFSVIDGRVGTKDDNLLWYTRTEYHCSRCGGHQGHVFEDGPQPTGQRWCNNGVALVFVPDTAFA